MKKRPVKRPDWNELMKEIDSFRYGKVGRLNKVVTNDRSKPILTKTKLKGQVIIFTKKEYFSLRLLGKRHSIFKHSIW